MRLMFYRPSSAHYAPDAAINFQTGVPVSSASSLEAHNAAFSLVGNSGNMIHRMAMVQALDFDRQRSASVNLLKLATLVGPSRAAEMVNENFDGAVLTFSNIVNAKADEGGLADILEHIEIPVVAVGIGIQEALPPSLDNLTPSVSSLLSLLDRKAVLFGVRGNATKKWLNDAGLKRPVAIGCPSIFVYPRNMTALKPPTKFDRVMVGGHLGAVNLRPDGNGRGRKLLAGLSNPGASEFSYVFQGEVRNYPAVKADPFAFNEATSMFDPALVTGEVERMSGLTSPFSRYYSFADVGSWRQACLRYDVFVGDRIHGAVAAMQAGVPALVLYNDERVLELTSYHGLPKCSLEEFADIGFREAIGKYLNEEAYREFRKRYEIVLKKFKKTLNGGGLKLATDAEIKSVVRA